MSTDHATISIKVQICKTDADVKLGNLPTRATQADIRRAAECGETVQVMLNLGNFI